MPNSLSPSYVQINYHGALAPHSHTIPTTEFNPAVGANGGYETWDANSIEYDVMIEALVDVLLPFYNSQTVYDNYVVFSKPTEEDDPMPVRSGNFTGKVGTDTSASWAGAVEIILLTRTENFGLSKLYLLDAVSDDNFNPVTTLAGRWDDLFQEFSAVTNAWSGRDNSRPATFLKYTKNINDKLREAYNLA